MRPGSIWYVHGSPEHFQPLTSRWPLKALSGIFTASPGTAIFWTRATKSGSGCNGNSFFAAFHS
jgi:hypothetical protein